MTREALFKRLTDANPSWLTDGPNLTAAGFRKLFDAVFTAGHDLGFRNGQAKAEMERPKANGGSVLDGLQETIRDIFGTKGAH